MVDVLNISGLGYFMPLFGFLFVFLIVFALLTKTKILGDQKYVNILISSVIAIIFATMSSVRDYVQTVTPWFAVLAIALFFILLLVGLSQKKVDDIVKPWFVWVFIVLLIIIFLVSATVVFSDTMSNFYSQLGDYITNYDRIVGGAVLLIVAIVVSWLITKK